MSRGVRDVPAPRLPTFGPPASPSGQDVVQRDELVVGAASGADALAEDRAPKSVTDAARVSISGGAGLRAGHGPGDASGGHGAAGATYGPEIAVRHTFAAPGRYKVWGQFLTHDGTVVTADFVVRVR